MPTTATTSQRRSGLGIPAFVIALLAALTLFAQPAQPAAATTTPAGSADAVVDSMGVATHTSYTNTVYYRRFAELKGKLAKLGIRHIREDLLPDRPDQYQRLNELADMGIGSTLIMGSPNNGIGGLETLLSVVRTKLEGVDALEGTNEFYLSGKANWTSLVGDYQRRLYEGAKASPATSSIPVLGPSTIFWQNGETGDLSQWLDYGTIHPYPGGYPSEEYLGRHMEFATRSSASKPLMATETGYHNAMQHTGGHLPVSEEAIAVYMPRLFLDAFDRGVRRTFTYELIDTFPNAANDDCEQHFGLLRNDLSEKPSFTALKNLISLLGDQGGRFDPGSLNLTIGGNRDNLRQVLLQKRDGSFYLVLWRNTRVWDPIRKVTLDPGSATVTVAAGAAIDGAQVYVPNVSAAPVESRPAVNGKISVEVGARVVILELGDGGGASAGDVGVSPAKEADSPVQEAKPIVTAPAPTTEPAAPTQPRSKRKSPRPRSWGGKRSLRTGQTISQHHRPNTGSSRGRS